jgi:hypothetical protein
MKKPALRPQTHYTFIPDVTAQDIARVYIAIGVARREAVPAAASPQRYKDKGEANIAPQNPRSQVRGKRVPDCTVGPVMSATKHPAAVGSDQYVRLALAAVRVVAAPSIIGRNIRDAFLSSAPCVVASIEATPARVPHLTLPPAISPRIRLIRRGKGPRRKFGSHPKARGTRWP